MVLIRLVNHRNYFLKLIGVLSFLAYLAFAVALNLTLSHLREIPPAVSLSDNVGQEVLHRLISAPYALTDINSWVFFSIGVIFSLIAMADGLLFFDPYVGYSGLERRWIGATRQFADARSELIERLRDIREDATEAMNEAARDLSVRRSEYDSLLQGRERLAQRFAQHQNQIEQAGRALLEIYREANRTSRATPAPDHFAKAFSMERITYASGEPAPGTGNSLRKMIAETQELLQEQIKAIHDAFDGAVRTYREIDELLPEKSEKKRA
jgi:hypothetical protein